MLRVMAQKECNNLAYLVHRQLFLSLVAYGSVSILLKFIYMTMDILKLTVTLPDMTFSAFYTFLYYKIV